MPPILSDNRDLWKTASTSLFAAVITGVSFYLASYSRMQSSIELASQDRAFIKAALVEIKDNQNRSQALQLARNEEMQRDLNGLRTELAKMSARLELK